MFYVCDLTFRDVKSSLEKSQTRAASRFLFHNTFLIVETHFSHKSAVVCQVSYDTQRFSLALAECAWLAKPLREPLSAFRRKDSCQIEGNYKSVTHLRPWLAASGEEDNGENGLFHGAEQTTTTHHTNVTPKSYLFYGISWTRDVNTPPHNILSASSVRRRANDNIV